MIPPQTKHQYSDRKVFLGGLAWSTTEVMLQEYLEKELGIKVEKVTIMRDRQTGNSRGFGFVILENADDADKVVTANHLLDSKKIEAKRAIPKDEIQESNTRKLFVGGIPVNITDEEFKSHFDQFGTVAEIQIVKDRNTGKSRGFGFVTFEDKDIVDTVLTFPHVLLGKQVEVKKAEPKKSTPTNEFGSDAYLTYLFGYPPYSSSSGSNNASNEQSNDEDANYNPLYNSNNEVMNLVSSMENLSFEEKTHNTPKSTLPSPRGNVMEMNQNNSNNRQSHNNESQSSNRKLVSPRNVPPSNTRTSPRVGRSLPNENVTINHPQKMQRSKSMEHLKVVGSYRPFNDPGNGSDFPNMYPNLTPPQTYNTPPQQQQSYNFSGNSRKQDRSLFSITEVKEDDVIDNSQYPPNQYMNQYVPKNGFPPPNNFNEMGLNNNYPPNLQFLPNSQYGFNNQFIGMNGTQFPLPNQFPPNNFNNQYPPNGQFNNINNNQYPPNNQFPPPNNLNNQYPPNNNQYPPNSQYMSNGQYPPNYPMNNSFNGFNNPNPNDSNFYFNQKDENDKLAYFKVNKRKSWSGRSNEYLFE